MNDDQVTTSTYRGDDDMREQRDQQEGSKGGESWFTTWYEFESERKKEEDERV